MSKYKILIGLTGSIACYKTCSLISQLVKAGHEVQVIATTSALKFVGDATFAGLTQRSTLSDTFTQDHMMDHIYLARWADIFIVAPITAHHINKFALGLADDLITTLYLAYEKSKPLYLAPAMNSVMYSHFSVQESLLKLKQNGAHILEPNTGTLACGEQGIGKMMEPEDIFKNLELDKNFSLAKKAKILLTFGGTREAIDGVRTIANTSTGETGAQLTDLLTSLNYEVTALASASGAKPKQAKSLIEFTDHSDLEQKIQNALSQDRYEAVIHLAAVSDFSVDKIIVDQHALAPSPDIKIGSEKPLTLMLKPNPKIVNNIKSYSKNPNVKVIAFKLTNTLNKTEQEQSVNKLLESAGIDYVVHNDLHTINKSLSQHRFQVYGQSYTHNRAIENTPNLAAELDKIIMPEVSHDSMS